MRNSTCPIRAHRSPDGDGEARRRRRLAVPAVALTVTATTAALLLAPSTSGSSAGQRLQAHVVATANAPLPACPPDPNDCTEANTVRHFIYVRNENPLPTSFVPPASRSRTTLPNAFVVTSVDERILVDGVEILNWTITPPPNTNYFFRVWSGHWPSTVTCPPGSDPCNVVDNPAVLPGEDVVVLYTGWAHGSTEPNGQYVFEYTVHGTLNDTPVVLTASPPPILMTP